MTKSDVSELKKLIDPDIEDCSINNILTIVVDEQKCLYQNVQSWFALSDGEQAEIFGILRKVLNNQIGKKFIKYPFIFDEAGESPMQNLLIELRDTRMEDEKVNERYIQKAITNIAYNSAYTLFTANITINFYNKTSKKKQEETLLLTAVCPIKKKSYGLMYDVENNLIFKKSKIDDILDKTYDGFLFPIYEEQEADVNHIMYYTASSVNQNVSFVKDFLQCNFFLSAERQKAYFWSIMSASCGDILDFQTVFNINQAIHQSAEKAARYSAVKELDCYDLITILDECKIPKEKIEVFTRQYEEKLGSCRTTLMAANISDKRINIKTDKNTITLDSNYASAYMNVQEINGQKCLVLPLNSKDIEIVGIQTTV